MSLIDNIMAVKCFDIEIKIVVFYRSRMDSLDKIGIGNVGIDNINYSYAVLNLSDISYNTPICVINKLADGYNYIAKHWM